MSSRLDLHEELCKILGSRNVYYTPPESVKMKYPAIVYSLNEYDNKSANSGVYLQWTGYSLTLIDKDPDSPIAKKLSVIQGCTLSRPPYPANGLYHFPFNLKTTGSDATKVFDEYYQKGYDDCWEVTKDGYENGYTDGQQSEYDRFWDRFQRAGAADNGSYYISGRGWDNITFKPKHDIILPSYVSRYFYNTGAIDVCARLKEKNLAFDTSKCITMTYICMDSSVQTLPTIDTRKINNLNYFVYNNTIKFIEKIILKSDGSQTFLNTTLGENRYLTHCIIEGCIGQSLNVSASPLDLESAKSFILALKDYSGTSKEYTYKLSLASTTKAYLEADGATAPEGLTWLEYARDIKCWNI